MNYLCPYCEADLSELSYTAMDALKEKSSYELNPQYITDCPNCNEQLKFIKSENNWHCLVLPDGSLRQIGIN